MKDYRKTTGPSPEMRHIEESAKKEPTPEQIAAYKAYLAALIAYHTKEKK